MGIRKATMNDEEAIYSLLSMLESETLNKEEYVKIYEENLSAPDVFYFVYEENARVVGFISMHIQRLLHHTGKIAEIQELIVDDRLRGKGIGKGLFQKAQSVAVENNCRQLEVCCNQTRLHSHQFYMAQGMKNSHYKFCVTLSPHQ